MGNEPDDSETKTKSARYVHTTRKGGRTMITEFRTAPTQDVDAMWEADAAAEWERINDVPDYSEQYKEAALDMKEATDGISTAIDLLSEAVEAVKGTDAEDKIVSLLNDLDDLWTDIRIMAKELKGERVV